MQELENVAGELELLAKTCSPVMTPPSPEISNNSLDVAPPLVDTAMNHRLFGLLARARMLRATAEEIRMRIAI